VEIFHYRKTLAKSLKIKNGSLGFVPTMGALHSGHLELVRESLKTCDHTIVSIFVNPTQFNNSEDLQNYPKTLAADLEKLNLLKPDFIFIPSINEVYDQEIVPETNIFPLDTCFEGKMRPGHFKGVTSVLYRFFELIHPNKVFMGLKDLQQCLVVQKLLNQHFQNIDLIQLPTVRENDGLAMSSRNARLSKDARLKAPAIYKELVKLKTAKGVFDIAAIESNAVLAKLGIETEYLNLVSLPDLNVETEISANHNQFIIFAGKLNGIRLIDNLPIDH
jgi:pantoate--beta-alanine ligase